MIGVSRFEETTVMEVYLSKVPEVSDRSEQMSRAEPATVMKVEVS